MTRANLVSVGGITLGLCLAGCSDYSVRKGEGRLDLSAASVDFGEVSVGTQSTVGLQATNVGMGTLAFLEVGLDDTTGESFDFLGLDHTELDPGDQTELQVRFVPEEVAQAYGNLIVETDDETWAVATVDLAAFGVQPTIDVDPETLWFGVVEVGGSNTLEVEIGAQGSGTLRIKELIFPGDEQAAYVVDLPEGVELPYELSPGLSFTLEVTFAPPDSEAYQGELIVSSNDSASSEVAITLIGNSEDDPTENSPPEVELTTPDWGDYLLTGETTTIQGIVIDEEDGPESLAGLLYANGDLIGTMTPGESGAVSMETDELPSGEVTLTLRAVDSEGEMGEDTVDIVLWDPEEPMEYVLSGGESVFDWWTADDDVTIYLDGDAIYVDDNGTQDDHPPVSFEAERGSVLEIVAVDENYCQQYLDALILHFGTGTSQELNEVQCRSACSSDSCYDEDFSGPWPNTFLDESYTIDIP